MDDHRRILDAYLQGAHLALLALEGKLREHRTLDADDVRTVLAELHDVFSNARQSLREGRAGIDLARLVSFPSGKN